MTPRMVRRLIALASLALAALVFGCDRPRDEAPHAAPAVVTASKPIRRQVTDYAHFTGRTAAVESVQLRARVSGYLSEIDYQPGDEVKQGKVLFRIDPVIYKAALEKAEADVKQFEAQLTELTEEYNRNRRLILTNAIPREDYQKSIAAKDQSRANLGGARAAVRTAKQNLTWTDVVAPVDGKTDVNLLTKGNLVVADQTLLTTIVSQDPMYVYFDVDESTMLRVQKLIRRGKATSYRDAAYPVAIGLTSEAGFPHQGRIDFVSNQVSPGTGTLNVRGNFSNKERILTPGLFVRVRIPIGRPHEGILVSDRALGSDQGEPFLLVVDKDDQVVRRNVTVGARQEDGLREITSGVGPDDWVIVDGLLRVRPGVTVAPKHEPMPTRPAGQAGQDDMGGVVPRKQPKK